MVCRTKKPDILPNVLQADQSSQCKGAKLRSSAGRERFESIVVNNIGQQLTVLMLAEGNARSGASRRNRLGTWSTRDVPRIDTQKRVASGWVIQNALRDVRYSVE